MDGKSLSAFISLLSFSYTKFLVRQQSTNYTVLHVPPPFHCKEEIFFLQNILRSKMSTVPIAFACCTPFSLSLTNLTIILKNERITKSSGTRRCLGKTDTGKFHFLLLFTQQTSLTEFYVVCLAQALIISS
jgi:hypothetical protein